MGKALENERNHIEKCIDIRFDTNSFHVDELISMMLRDSRRLLTIPLFDVFISSQQFN